MKVKPATVATKRGTHFFIVSHLVQKKIHLLTELLKVKVIVVQPLNSHNRRAVLSIFMDNQNTWFYLLSTTAQTCGAVLALSAAFVVFKLAEISESIKNYRARVITVLEWKHPNKLKPFDFFNMSSEIILDEYLKNKDVMWPSFDADFAINLSEKYKNDRLITSPFNRNKAVGEGRKWCSEMVTLLDRNIKIKRKIFRLLFWAIFLLTMSILYGVLLLTLGAVNSYLVGNTGLLITNTALVFMALIISSITDWIIAKQSPVS